MDDVAPARRVKVDERGDGEGTLMTLWTWECMMDIEDSFDMRVHEGGTLKTPYAWERMRDIEDSLNMRVHGGGRWTLKTPLSWECMRDIEDTLAMRVLECHWRLLMHENAWVTFDIEDFLCMRVHEGHWRLLGHESAWGRGIGNWLNLLGGAWIAVVPQMTSNMTVTFH